jgi:hypothetical protein
VSIQPSSRWRKVTTISDEAERARRNSTIFSRSAAPASPVIAGMRSASKRTMRVQQIRREIPFAAPKSMTKRSRSWSSE